MVNMVMLTQLMNIIVHEFGHMRGPGTAMGCTSKSWESLLRHTHTLEGTCGAIRKTLLDLVRIVSSVPREGISRHGKKV